MILVQLWIDDYENILQTTLKASKTSKVSTCNSESKGNVNTGFNMTLGD